MSDEDRWSFNEGTHADLGRVLGSRLNGQGATFRVWAPSASRVMVIGDFNDWSEGIDLAPDPSGVWNGQLPGVEGGAVYKYRITDSDGNVFDKADPVAAKAEEPPRTGSVAPLHP
jgi:1,4-alpha-glucan branching enzyme